MKFNRIALKKIRIRYGFDYCNIIRKKAIGNSACIQFLSAFLNKESEYNLLIFNDFMLKKTFLPVYYHFVFFNLRPQTFNSY